jgi:hypothetical protein
MIRTVRQALALIAFTAALLGVVGLFILEAGGSKAVRSRRQRLLRAALLLLIPNPVNNLTAAPALLAPAAIVLYGTALADSPTKWQVAAARGGSGD